MKKRRQGKLITFNDYMRKLEKLEVIQRNSEKDSIRITDLEELLTNITKKYEETAKCLNELQSNELIALCIEAYKNNLLPEDDLVNSLHCIAIIRTLSSNAN